MKAIILAAGQGQRLRPYTDNKPKCLVEYRGMSIIRYILNTMKKSHIKDITLVGGYRQEVLKEYLKKDPLKFYENPEYDSTNMLYTLFCAEKEMDDDLIISYSDIIYRENVLEKLINTKANMAVVVDKEWEKLWKIRMEDPLADAETMKLNNYNNITELGKKPVSYDDIQGQYIGLIKISKHFLPELIRFYHNLDKNAIYDGKDFKNMYMTSFIQMVLENISPVKAALINGGWMEIDSIKDLANYEENDFSVW